MERAEFYREARTDLTGPLDGVRVLDVSKVWAGPMASCVLGDLGADVIRVELPGGRDGELPPRIPGTKRSWFRETVNRNKRSVALDLRDPEGRRRFLRLVRHADVVVENYRPGVLDGWGVGYRACRAVRPDVVYVSISGYGQYGPRSELPGYDPVVQAYGGWMSLNADPAGAPRRAPTFLADDLAGLHGAIGALAALRHRDTTGEGQHVDVAMLDCLLAGSSGRPTLAASGIPPSRDGNETDFTVPANTFACRDGVVYLAAPLNRQWRALAEALGRPELGRDARFATADARLANRGEVNRVVGAWCAENLVAHVTQTLESRAVPVAEVRELGDVVRDPHVLVREMVQPVRLSDGGVAALTGPAAKFSRTPTRIRRAAPPSGGDTGEVVVEFGLDGDEPTSASQKQDRSIV